MTSAFRNEVTIEYAANGNVETTFGTALAANKLTASFRATELSPFTVIPVTKDFYNCAANEILTSRTLTRYVRGTFSFEATPQLLGWVAALGLGSDSTSGSDPLVHQINVSSTRQVPFTTIRVGHNGLSGGTATVGRVYKDVMINKFSISSASGPDSVITVQVEFIASASFAAGVSTTYATCYSTTPSLLSDTGSIFTVGGSSYYSLLRKIDISWDNKIMIADDAFTLVPGSVDIQRGRRAAVTDKTFLFEVEGTPEDTLYALGAANSNAGTPSTAVVWRVGSTTNGFTWNVPTAIIALQQDQVGSYGEAGTSTIKLMARATKSGGAATEPVNAIAYVPLAEQATAYLVAA